MDDAWTGIGAFDPSTMRGVLMEKKIANHRSILTRLAWDQAGAVLSIETLLVASVIVIGGVVMIAAMRDSLTSELSDVAGSVQDVNLSFTFNGATSASSSVAGSSYSDQLDVNDSPGDAPGAVDNCITFTVPPLNEGQDVSIYTGPSPFSSSDVGTFSFTGVTNGKGGSATGTIGDGTIDTGFTVTTIGGNISGTSQGSELRFFETPGNSGTFTIAYDDPITDAEFWVRNLAAVSGDPENLLGNFTVTLSDGTVLNNAAFTVVPDAIAPNSSYGQFSTLSADSDSLAVVTRGGNQYVMDSVANGNSMQAAGRVRFTGLPPVANPPGAGSVGISSISFDRSGGTTNFRATFSTSGRVLSTN